eukprot:TRINITY_DN11110_c0_g1_i2.p1 TRINITY_DN11110_c0_g1~~TRINITY_DN11110_c0_g1_i2.p1  ORF type:complete len:1366 (-),score=363.37 TRINITY_DN11110_c0_g1_i2:286-4383(-)
MTGSQTVSRPSTTPRRPLVSRGLVAGAPTGSRQGVRPRTSDFSEREDGKAGGGHLDVIAALANDDPAKRRLLKTPRVFQSNGAVSSQNQRRELRANLLPSILRTPKDMAGSEEGQGPGVEVDGDFYKLYHEKLQQREVAESAVDRFLERDDICNDASTNPLQMVAASCSCLTDLVQDRLKKFRRPKESFLDTSNELPFQHNDKGMDLAELSDLLTIDLERYEFPFKGTVKRPGFTSLQIASRVPLIVRDPLAHGEQRSRLKSERLENDVHVIRLDLQPGEVRQMTYRLDDAEFLETKLAERMSALVAPEESVLADIVKRLHSRQSEVKAITSVFDDILRDIPSHISSSEAPPLDVEAVLKCGELEGKAMREARTEALTRLPRQTLQRLMEAMDRLGALLTPIIPEIAHALDRASLIAVREVDRLASRCSLDYEELYQKWAESVARNKLLTATIERMGGTISSAGSVEFRSRAVQLEEELARQERTMSALLTERTEHDRLLNESDMLASSLRQKVETLESAFHKIRDALDLDLYGAELGLDLELSSPTGSAPPLRSVAAAPAPEEPTSPTRSFGGKGLPGAVAVAMAAKKRLAPSAKIEVKRQLDRPFVFRVSSGVQTDTEIFFNDAAVLPDSMLQADHCNILEVAARLTAALMKYQWNSLTGQFLCQGTQSLDEETQDNVQIISKLAEKRAATRRRTSGIGLVPLAIDAKQSVEHLTALHVLQKKAEDASGSAKNLEKEFLITTLSSSMQGRFEDWLAEYYKARALLDDSDLKAISPVELWKRLKDCLHLDAAKARIGELEGHLANLLPHAENMRLQSQQGGETGERAFWRRIIRRVQEQSILHQDEVSIFATAHQLRKEIGTLLLFINNPPDGAATVHNKISASVTMQSYLKSYYIRKHGRMRQVETAAGEMASAVLQFFLRDDFVGLFAILCDIPYAGMKENAFVYPARGDVEAFSERRLELMPADAPQVVAAMVASIQAERQDTDSPIYLPDAPPWKEVDIPLDTCIRLCHPILSQRSRTATKLFGRLLYGYASFEVVAELRRQASTIDSSEDDSGSESGSCSFLARQHTLQDMEHRKSRRSTRAQRIRPNHKMLFVSYFLGAYLERERMSDPAFIGVRHLTSEQVGDLWDVVQEEAANLLDDGLDLKTGAEAKPTDFEMRTVAKAMVQAGILELPEDFVEEALLAAAGYPEDELEESSEAICAEEDFRALTLAHTALGLRFSLSDMTTEGSRDRPPSVLPRCKSSRLLWSLMWALIGEREVELELMEEMFVLYDDSGDGWLQFDEFQDLISAVAPLLPADHVEEAFLAGAEASSGDMTRDSFAQVIRRMGISSNVDFLEEVIAQKRAKMYGSSIFEDMGAF